MCFANGVQKSSTSETYSRPHPAAWTNFRKKYRPQDPVWSSFSTVSEILNDVIIGYFD